MNRLSIATSQVIETDQCEQLPHSCVGDSDQIVRQPAYEIS